MDENRRTHKVVKSCATIEGAGVHPQRAIGFGHPEFCDRFLLLDDFRSDELRMAILTLRQVLDLGGCLARWDQLRHRVAAIEDGNGLTVRHEAQVMTQAVLQISYCGRFHVARLATSSGHSRYRCAKGSRASMATSTRFANKLVGEAGEHYAVSQFSFIGKYAAKMPDNWEAYDLAVETGAGLVRASVKTRSEGKGWKLLVQLRRSEALRLGRLNPRDTSTLSA